jgi:citrate lyase subunit alpha / citrate CoA-transferase
VANIERRVPDFIPGYGPVKPYSSPFANLGLVRRAPVRLRSSPPRHKKVLPNLAAAIAACEIKSGATISFHHHLRNGDKVLNAVLAEIEKMGLTDITVAASALFPVHASLLDHIRRGTVTRICASTIYGPLAAAVSQGQLASPVLMYTHGGRTRCIESGDLHIDATFVAAPTADTYGNLNGIDGKSACGSLGYAVADAHFADNVVAITDNLVPYPAAPIEISQDYVDYVVNVDSIGDSSQIVSGTTHITTNPIGLRIAEMAAQIIEASGYLRDGFSFQTGAGGTSLAVAACIKRKMLQAKVQGSFAAGGITGGIVEMLDAGLFRGLLDVQAFDLRAIDSLRRNSSHQSMSASMYANPHNRGCVVNQLDTVILGAAEIDVDFNVNVSTGADGLILGGSGGHADTAAGAKLALITTQLNAGIHPKIVERVNTVTTPGETVDAVVTNEGVAVNPRRSDLADRLSSHGIPVVSIHELLGKAKRHGSQHPPETRRVTDRVVAVVEYRDGTVIDVVRSLENGPQG